MPETKTKKKPLGRQIAGSTEAPPSPSKLAGRLLSLDLNKRSFFEFPDRRDFSLTRVVPSAKLPDNLTQGEVQMLTVAIARGEVVLGKAPALKIKKDLNKVRPYVQFIENKLSFSAIQKRVNEIVMAGANINGSGYNAREVLEMLIEKEMVGQSRNDVLNYLHNALERVPGHATPADEPGTHEVHEVVAGGVTDVQPDLDRTHGGSGAAGGSSSAKHAIGKEPSASDKAKL